MLEQVIKLQSCPSIFSSAVISVFPQLYLVYCMRIFLIMKWNLKYHILLHQSAETRMEKQFFSVFIA